MVEWGEYRLGDLFEIQNTLSFNTEKLVSGNKYDYVTRTSLNQGVLQTTGFVNSENINSSGIWSLGLLQMDFFYRKKPWYAGQFVRKIIPKIEIPKASILYFSTLLNKQKQKLLSVLVRNVDNTFRETVVHIPTKKGKIDFEFMEKFIAELEAQRFAELEAYLSITGLKNTHLSLAEEQALNDLKNVNWENHKMDVLFEKVKTKKLPFKADDLPKERTGKYTLPCLTSSFRNQGLNYYAPKEGATVLNNVISLPSNSDVYRAYFQSNDFTVLSDSYALRWIYNDVKLNSKMYLFSVVCINKVTDLPIYSYKNKLGGWNAVKNKYIHLPTQNGQPDYEFMSTLISAIQKLVITDVVAYSDEKIKATQTVIDREV